MCLVTDLLSNIVSSLIKCEQSVVDYCCASSVHDFAFSNERATILIGEFISVRRRSKIQKELLERNYILLKGFKELFKRRGNSKVSQKFCNILSYFVFPQFWCLFTKPILLRYQLMVFYEGPSSVKSVWVFVLVYCSTISGKTSSSTTEDLSDLGLSSRLVSLSLKHLNQF